MSKPRYIVKERLHLVSRECFLGRDYLPTSREARLVFAYVMHEAYRDDPLTCEEQLVDALALLRAMAPKKGAKGRALRWTFRSSSRSVARPDHVFSEVMPARAPNAFGPPTRMTSLKPEELQPHVTARTRVRRRAQRGVRQRGHSGAPSAEPEEPSSMVLAPNDEADRLEVSLRRRFWRAYRKAWRALKAGVRRLFPRGTWWLAHHRIVRMADHPG